MKTKNVVKAVLMFSMVAPTFGYAQSLNNDPININGYVQEDVMPTDAELENVNNEIKRTKNAIIINKQKKKKYNDLSNKTEKLAEETEELIEERKEYKKIVSENNKKIECLMAEGMKPGCEEYVKAPKEDRVTTKQAAVQVTEAKMEAPVKSDEFGSTIKVIPYTGMSSYITENENLEGNLIGGVKVETNVNERFSVGMGFTYSTMNTTDYGNDNDYFSTDFNYDSLYGGREIEYSNMNFDVYSKFYIVKNNRFRPYIGAGLGYNRSTLNYTGSNSNNSNGYDYNGNSYPYNIGNEEVTTSSINMELMVGSEIKFSESIGANLELSYMRGIGGNLSSENARSTQFSPDQQRLQDLSDELSEANVIGVFAGLLVEF